VGRQSVGWPISQLVGSLVSWLVDQKFGGFFSHSFDACDSWSSDQLIGSSVGCLVVQSVH
jgi:hypothetical protein